jgi:hypothetical protein
MSIIDPEFEINPKPYVVQMTIAGIFMLFAFVGFNIYTQSALIAGFSSSVFLAFAIPDSHSTDIRPMVGGYLVAILVGAFLSLIYMSALSHDILGAFGALFGLAHISSYGISPYSPAYIAFFAFLAFIITAFTMATTDTEHAPAVGIAVGMIINPWSIKTIAFLIIGISVLALLKKALEKWMVNLV